ncbi:MAG: TonB-dependent receptor [Bacteroidales bacterium]|jgi:iron complex outermembrane receptor protein
MIKRIMLIAASCFVALAASAQLTITGKVTDEQDQPLAGANVLIDHTFMGVMTKDDGTFLLKSVPPGKYTLIFSFVGFQKQEYPLDLAGPVKISIQMKATPVMGDEVIIRGTRAGSKDPVTYFNIGQEQIRSENQTRDIPYLLLNSPSVVATSDAGTGVGYSALRIRGTDASRINVTINGVPFNDSESHEVYWVDIPDILSSTENIQVQRGVGSSTQGAAAFGANINFQTLAMKSAPSAEFNASAGSFNTWKTSLNAGTGLINDHFTMDVRLTKIHSDGFIDRAYTDLGSAYLSAGYYSKKNIIKTTFFTGKERTYQAWGGVPSEMLTTNRTNNPYTYKDEVDDYLQNNAQLHWSSQLRRNLDLSVALHYTGGSGYYEQYREEEALADYLIAPVIMGSDTISSCDLVRRKWLRNQFYGAVYTLNYHRKALTLTAGGGMNQYYGDHFGRVIWSQFASDAGPDHEYYFNKGIKTDANQFVKMNWQVLAKASLYADLQYRTINYRISGIDDNQANITQTHQYHFLNPKFGVTYEMAENQKSFISYAIAHREPTRGNFVDAPVNQAIKPEILRDVEAGYQLDTRLVSAGLTFYWMDYKDQLILTGQINDVGAPIMVNIPSSFRTGIESSVKINPFKTVELMLNLTLSRNSIRNFTEFVDDWDTGGQRTAVLGQTNLAFSPEIISGGRLSWLILNDLRFVWDSRYVGRQFIDNSSDLIRSLDPYWINNISLDWTMKPQRVKELVLFFQINNLLNHQYETNAWVYSYYYKGNRGKMDGYFPQAGINFMGGIRIRL